jgi:hypothetical protein
MHLQQNTVSGGGGELLCCFAGSRNMQALQARTSCTCWNLICCCAFQLLHRYSPPFVLLLLWHAQVLAAEQINMILTAVVAGMRPDEPSDDARLAATTALQNAIEFAEHNFDNESERNYIMQVRSR